MKLFLWLFCLAPALPALSAPIQSEPNQFAAAPVGVSPAAEATLSGKVHVLGAPDALPGVVVRRLGQSLTAQSDEKGRYQLSGEPGIWVLRATADGFADLSRTVRLKPGERRRLDLGLNPNSFQAEDVVVTGHRDRPQAIQASVTRREIKQIPGNFGDALRAVQNLPGVAAPNDFSGQLLVQGAGPRDNLYLIDGLPWPIPFHFGGLVSTINPDLLSSVDLYEAGYGARWGGSLAAVLDAKTAPAPTDRLHLDADLSVLEADASVQGPLGAGDATFTLGGRRSYFEVLGRAEGLSAVPSYWDGGGALDFSANRANHFHLLALSSDDALNAITSDSSGDNPSASIRYNQDFQSGGLSWTNTGLADFVSTLTPYVYHTDSIIGLDQFTINNYQTTYGLKEEGVWKAGRWLGAGHEVGAGATLELSDYTFKGYFPRVTSTANISFADLTSMAALPSTVEVQGYNGSAYLQDRLRLDAALALTLGLHYDSSSWAADGRLGPRAGLEWQVDPADKLSAAWGLYDQAPTPLNVNPQYGNPGLQPEDAQHVALAYEHAFNARLSVKADGYYKTLGNLVVNDPSNPYLYSNQGVGDVKGVDLSLKEDLGERFFGWITYSHSNSERLNLPTQAWSLYQYDQPDILNLVGSYSPWPGWTLGGKLRYNSGNLVQSPGSDTYDQRLADYLRLDLRVDKAWRFQTWSLKVYGEVLNVLNRSNPAMEFVNNKTGETQVANDLPRLPNIGLEASY